VCVTEHETVEGAEVLMDSTAQHSTADSTAAVQWTLRRTQSIYNTSFLSLFPLSLPLLPRALCNSLTRGSQARSDPAQVQFSPHHLVAARVQPLRVFLVYPLEGKAGLGGEEQVFLDTRNM